MADADLMDFLTVDQEPEVPEPETPEIEAPEEEPEETPEGEPAPDKPVSLFQADGKKLDPAVKAGLAKLKAESPEVAKLVTRALYRTAELEREFPGGLTEAKELRDKLDGLGGFAAVEEKLADLEFFDGIDKKFTAADPGFVDELANADPAAFAKLAPAVFSKFNEISPDGWKKYIGSIVYGDFQRNEVPAQMSRLGDALRRNDAAAATESYNLIAGYLASFRELAELKVSEPQAKAPAVQPKSDDRETSLRQREWKIEHDGIERRIFSKEYTAAISGRKVSTQDEGQIKELFHNKRLTLSRQYFPDAAKKLDQLLKSNDKAGFMRQVTLMHKRITPEAMRWAVLRTLKSAPAKPAAPKPNVLRETPRPEANGDQGSQFKLLAAEPDTWSIDYDWTSSAMLNNNTAILKNGTKVSWRDRK